MPVPAKKAFGIEVRKPGIYSKSRFPLSPGSNGAPSNVVVVLGTANGGIPYNAAGVSDEDKLQAFSSVPDLQNALRGGPGYYMCEFYLTPHRDPNFNTPQSVIFVRVDPATQSSGAIKDAASGTVTIIDLKSTRYGLLANQLAEMIQPGSVSGYKITGNLAGTTAGLQDNIGKNAFTIQYIGGGSAAVLNITATTLSTTVTGGGPGDNLSFTLAQFESAGQLIAQIAANPSYTCQVAGPSNQLPSQLDIVSGQDIRTTSYTVAANIQAVIDFFNNQTQGEFTANLHSGSTRVPLQTGSSFVFLTGATSPSATNTDWINALALLEKHAINHILPASGDTTIQQLVAAHVESMSNVTTKKNRSAGMGATAAQNTFSLRAGQIRALNSARCEYHITPFNRLDVIAGVDTQFDPFYGAALTAGYRFANNLTMSPTFKTLQVTALGENYSPTDIEKYLAAGATLFERQDRGFVVTHLQSTYQGENLILNLPSMLRTCDFITLDSQRKLEARIATLDRAPNALELNEFLNWINTNLLPSYVAAGFLTKDPNDDRAAFTIISFSVIGDAFYLKFKGIVPAPLHYGFIDQTFEVVGSNVVAAAA